MTDRKSTEVPDLQLQVTEFCPQPERALEWTPPQDLQKGTEPQLTPGSCPCETLGRKPVTLCPDSSPTELQANKWVWS